VVSFKKDRMNGYGTGVTYKQKDDVLTIDKEAHVEMHDADNNVTLDFDSDTATLDRTRDLLTLQATSTCSAKARRWRPITPLPTWTRRISTSRSSSCAGTHAWKAPAEASMR
jgi:hypothetical protein